MWLRLLYLDNTVFDATVNRAGCDLVEFGVFFYGEKFFLGHTLSFIDARAHPHILILINLRLLRCNCPLSFFE